jgi:hypothetical protein
MANAVDQTVPQNSESPTLGAQRIRETRSGFNNILTVEHDISDSATTKGFHGTNVTGKVDTSIVPPPSGYGRFGWKTISGVAELFYVDDAGNEKQITTAGKLNAVDADGIVVKTGDQTGIAGVKTFTSIPKIPTTAPTADEEVAGKKYVDDQWSPTAYAAGETSTEGNGLITKMGKTGSIAGGATVTVTFATPFTNLVSVQVTMQEAAARTSPLQVSVASVNSISIYNPNSGSVTGAYWIAKGN